MFDISILHTIMLQINFPLFLNTPSDKCPLNDQNAMNSPLHKGPLNRGGV